MRKPSLVIVILFCAFVLKAQNKTNAVSSEKKNEIKLNLVLPPLGAFEAGYERILNEKSSLGISGFFTFNEQGDYDVNYFITPYYRRCFGKNLASGFFLEGFGNLSSIDGKNIIDIDGNKTPNEESDVIDFALGLSIGSKWITKSGLTFEFYGGLGRLLFNANKTDHDIVTRFGINIGYRF